MKTTTPIYKLDTKGKIRIWWAEYDEEKCRFHSGQKDGKIVVSGWRYPKAKNVGRANEKTVAEQVEFEVFAKEEKQLYQGKYFKTEEEAKAKFTRFIEPMLAHKFDSKAKDAHTFFPCLSQPKFDGIRCLISKDGMQSRNGKPIVSAPHIHRDLVASGFFENYPDVILDGELYNHKLKEDFQTIVSLARKTKPTPEDLELSEKMVQIHVYDVILDAPLEDRMEFIATKIPELDCVRVAWNCTLNSVEEANEMFSKYLEEGYEGQMLRIFGSEYCSKRSKNLLKHKAMDDDEFEIVDILEGQGNWAGFAKKVTIRLKDGQTQSSGMRGTQEFAKHLLENKDSFIGTTVTVNYFGFTDEGKLRFPVITKFWGGKREL